jgi:Na+/melibiose symporter-like transporter
VLISKFALAVAAGLALPSLKVFGYVPGQFQTTIGLTALYVFLPIVFKGIAILVLLPELGGRQSSRVSEPKES